MNNHTKWHGHVNWLALPAGPEARLGGYYCNDCGRKLVIDETIEEGTAKRDGAITRVGVATAEDLDTVSKEHRDQLPVCS